MKPSLRFFVTKFMNLKIHIFLTGTILLLAGSVLFAQHSETEDPFKRDPLFTRSLDELFGISEEEPGEEAVRDERGERRVRYMAYRGIDLGGSIEAGPYHSSALYSQYPNLPMIHYNRVNGLFLGLRKERMQWYRYSQFLNIPGINPHGFIGWGTASKEWEYAIGAEKLIGRKGHLMVGGEYHRGSATEDFNRVGLNETTLTSLMAGYDFPDYYKMEGFGLYTLVRTRRWLEAGFSYSRNSYTSLQANTDYSIFGKSSIYRPNPPLDPESDSMDLAIYSLSLAFNPRLALISHDFTIGAQIVAELADNSGSDSDYRFNKFFSEVKMFYNFEPGSLLSWRVQAGEITGRAPAFKQFYLGGIGTLRGSPYKFFSGNQMVASNIEIKLGRPSAGNRRWMSNYHLHLLLFLDSGWTGSTSEHSGSDDPLSRQSDTLKSFRISDLQHDFGIGLGTGAFRAELAWPLKTFDSSPVFWIRFNPTF